MHLHIIGSVTKSQIFVRGVRGSTDSLVSDCITIHIHFITIVLRFAAFRVYFRGLEVIFLGRTIRNGVQKKSALGRDFISIGSEKQRCKILISFTTLVSNCEL